MTIIREIREKVIQLSKEGQGRNEIARLLKGQLSEGSVGNIIRAYRHEQLSQPVYSSDEQSLPNNTDIITGISIKKIEDAPVLSGTRLYNLTLRRIIWYWTNL